MYSIEMIKIKENFMKKILIMLLVLITVVAGQNIKVLETKVLIKNDNSIHYAFPNFSPQGDKILYTTVGYKGLWLYNLDDNTTIQLNNLRGAGYKPVFSPGGEKIFFRHEELIKKRRYFSISHQSIENREIHDLIQKERDVSTPRKSAGNIVIYKAKNQREIYSCDKEVKLLEESIEKEINAFTENSKLYLEINGEKSVIEPVGKGHYIWGSISPDRDKILFTLVGKGTFVTNLNGEILLNIKNANFPKWSSDGKWIVFMNDKDNGHKVTSSDIMVIHVESKNSFTLTNNVDKIAMYPSWSENKIVYQTAQGNIEMLIIEFQE